MWNPEQYNKYTDYRTRPALDLLNAIPNIEYATAVDLGCGTGHITQMIKDKFKPTNIIGMDSSESMLKKAQHDYTDINWQLGDIAKLEHQSDLIFSTSALQWLNNHQNLFINLIDKTNKVMAIQMPHNFASPSHMLLRETINENSKFKTKLHNIIGETPIIREEPVFSTEKYYEILSPYITKLDIWQTTYLQQLSGENPVLDWIKGTALIPVEENFTPDEFNEFNEFYASKLKHAYPKQANGITLFPFSRIFVSSPKSTVN